MAYLKDFTALLPAIKSAHGTPLIVTAEPEEHLAATLAKTGYQGETIVDPENVLAKELKARDLLNVAITEKAGYAHGMAQPAVLVLRKGGEKLFAWNIEPTMVSSSWLAFWLLCCDGRIVC